MSGEILRQRDGWFFDHAGEECAIGAGGEMMEILPANRQQHACAFWQGLGGTGVGVAVDPVVGLWPWCRLQASEFDAGILYCVTGILRNLCGKRMSGIDQYVDGQGIEFFAQSGWATKGADLNFTVGQSRILSASGKGCGDGVALLHKGAGELAGERGAAEDEDVFSGGQFRSPRDQLQIYQDRWGHRARFFALGPLPLWRQFLPDRYLMPERFPELVWRYWRILFGFVNAVLHRLVLPDLPASRNQPGSGLNANP